MKKVISGLGVDTTATVMAAMKQKNLFWLADLYLIGEPDDPEALYLAAWEGPLHWSMYGTFLAADISRDTVPCKVGLEVPTLKVEWRPPYSPPTQSLATAPAYQRAIAKYYDNWPVRIWRAYMPTPGDANTYGCREVFGGRVGDITVERGVIRFTCNAFLDVTNQNVPSQVVEISNPLASAIGATPPGDLDNVPSFNIIAGSTDVELICDCISPAHHIFNNDELHNGFVVFENPAGATLARQWAGIQNNRTINIDGTDYNAILLYSRLPLAPTPGVDQFYVSGSSPVNLSDGDYIGFPYVPNPETAA